MRLLLIRHGQTPANVRGELATARPGPGLTPLGLEQADAVVDALAGEQIAAVYASPLVRTSLTGAPLARAHGLEIEVLEGLEEIEAGDLEDRSDMPSVMIYVKAAFGWAEGKLDARIPGHRRPRILRPLRPARSPQIAARHPDDTVAVVSHGAAIRVWSVARGANLTGDSSLIRHLDNTGVVVLNGSPAGGWVVETWEGEPVGGSELADRRRTRPDGRR